MRMRTWLLLLAAVALWPLSVPARPRLPDYPDRREDGSVRSPRDLTPRQQEIVALVGMGLSHKEVAARLGVCEATIKNHCAEMYRTTGRHGQSALAVWAATDALIARLAERLPRVVYSQPPHYCKGKRFIHAHGLIRALLAEVEGWR